MSEVLRPYRSPTRPKICEPNRTPILLALTWQEAELLRRHVHHSCDQARRGEGNGADVLVSRRSSR